LSPSRPGLRERKKVRTRSTIQHEALRLIREQGYDETTVSQIAEAAEVSESTFFRYFPTKEALFLEDDFDEVLVEAYRSQPPGLNPIQAMRAAMRETFQDITPEEIADLRQRMELVMAVPELRDAVAGHLVVTLNETAGMIASRAGQPGNDLRVRVLAGAILGAVMAATFGAWDQMGEGYVDLLDEALAQLEQGFNLD
jgi:AcrR family transcriptional regulator